MTATTLKLHSSGRGYFDVFYTNPDYVKFFFEDEVGNIMLAVGVGLQVVGYLIMKKIVNIEV